MNDPTKSKYRYLAFTGKNYRRYVQETDDELKKHTLEVFHADMPAHGTYGALLFDPRWRARREQILNRDGNKCVICQSTSKLQVHHRQYQFNVKGNQFRLPWEYEDGLLLTLCESCHSRGHSKYKIPIINL
jgi:hypothetical protein